MFKLEKEYALAIFTSETLSARALISSSSTIIVPAAVPMGRAAFLGGRTQFLPRETLTGLLGHLHQRGPLLLLVVTKLRDNVADASLAVTLTSAVQDIFYTVDQLLD